MWMPPEIKDPVLQHPPTRKSVACFGAVNLATGAFARVFLEIFNAETFRDFPESCCGTARLEDA